MFKKANKLLKEREKLINESEVHVVSFSWNGFTPVLKAFDGEEVREIDLGSIDLNISQEKTCVGSFDDDYTPCPKGRVVIKFNQCQECAPDSIPDLECIFEPQECEECEGGFCEEEHAVYLAFHGKYPKIGMTRKERLEERMIEQGADAYALMVTTEHRVDAREEEKGLSDRLGIPQKVGRKKKLKTFSRKIDKELIRRKYTGVDNRAPVGKLNFLNDYPISLPLRAEPRTRPTAGLHRGDMIGVKGKYLIYENSGLQALDLSDMPGRKMKLRE